jgi:hypothetical protein
MRRAIIEIDPATFVGMLRGHSAIEVASNVPADTVIVGCGWDENRRIVRLAVESSEFDDIADGMFAPNFDVIMWSRFPSETDRFTAAMELLGRVDS